MTIKGTQLKEKFTIIKTAENAFATTGDLSGWTFINRWRVEPQRDDRTPMRGNVAERPEAASAHRSFARRTHQESFKVWSKERHD